MMGYTNKKCPPKRHFTGETLKFHQFVRRNRASAGENRQIQSQLLRIDPEDDFGIMLATCAYDTIGAITVKTIEA